MSVNGDAYRFGRKMGEAGEPHTGLPYSATIQDVIACRKGWDEGHLTYLRRTHAHLSGLVSYLLRNYPDDQWDDSTKELFEAANAHMGNAPIEWMVDGPEEH